MIYWSEYTGHDITTIKDKDLTIYTFDIESTSYLIHNDAIISTNEYLSLTEKERQQAIPQATMYIWQFSINDTVYYGRTWAEFKAFIDRLERNSKKKKLIFVHNLSFEFQFLRSVFKIKSVFSRKSRKVMKCTLLDYKITFQCSLFMSGVKLAKLPEIYGLDVKKLEGDLDYSKLRTSITPLTETELAYCEHDCLVLYEYIKKELLTYETVFKIPLTMTGKVRRELQNLLMKDYKYRNEVRKSINIKPSVYNRLIEAFAGGYTHANYIYSDEVINDVDSYDEASAYPYVMVTRKFPMRAFRECKIRSVDDMLPEFAYLVRVRFKKIRCKYYNNFISASKCLTIAGATLDNGRVIRARELTITLTDIDFRFFCDTYTFESCEVLESYYSLYSYLPEQFVRFILEKYYYKTKYKGVKGKELFYALEKAKYNSLYGMTVTNMIRDEVLYDNLTGWSEKPLTDVDIYDKLIEELSKSFLSFSWGVWITSYARDNLLRRVIDLDQYVIYCDTDSAKVVEGYNKDVFTKYNVTVMEQIKQASKNMGIPEEYFMPKDQNGKPHPLGVFEYEEHYDKFITQGAKKYCVEKDGQLYITVSGVPKSGAECLNKIEDFKDNLVFTFDKTKKNTIIYNDCQMPIDIIDYKGVKYTCNDKTSCVLLPAEYSLSKSYEYTQLLTDNSSKRAKFTNE